MDLADLIVEREEEGYFAYHRSALTSTRHVADAGFPHFARCVIFGG